MYKDRSSSRRCGNEENPRGRCRGRSCVARGESVRQRTTRKTRRRTARTTHQAKIILSLVKRCTGDASGFAQDLNRAKFTNSTAIHARHYRIDIQRFRDYKFDSGVVVKNTDVRRLQSLTIRRMENDGLPES